MKNAFTSKLNKQFKFNKEVRLKFINKITIKIAKDKAIREELAVQQTTSVRIALIEDNGKMSLAINNTWYKTKTFKVKEEERANKVRRVTIACSSKNSRTDNRSKVSHKQAMKEDFSKMREEVITTTRCIKSRLILNNSSKNRL